MVEMWRLKKGERSTGSKVWTRILMNSATSKMTSTESHDQVTAFALLDNVAHQKYELYYNYPVTGIQFFAGVKLKF